MIVLYYHYVQHSNSKTYQRNSQRAIRGAIYTLLDPTGSNIAYSVYSSAKAMAAFSGGNAESYYPELAEAVRGYITLVDISMPLLALSRG